ncbi:MAG: IS256 family transposase [Acidimicrobiales bacterium]
MLSVVNEEVAVADGRSMLDEICREGAQRMLAAALEAEVTAYVSELVGERDPDGHRLVTRNGHARSRTIATVAGSVEIRQPRVDDRRVDPVTGEKATFKSALVPPWCRKSPKVTEVLPLLYLHGLSTGDFIPALESFFGSAAGLSPSVITRLTRAWEDDHRTFMGRDLSDRDFVYVWADGVHFNVRLEEERLCCLVIIGVRLDGTKELVAVADGYRESKDSWAALLRDLRHRGMCAPVLGVGDGALGFWAALRDVFPETKEQRCWVHKAANVLDALPRSIQPLAKKMLAEIRDAEDRDHARNAAKAFDNEFRAKWPKAADKISVDLPVLLAFFDFPAEHWIHLKTTNAIESTFATVRLRTKVTKGPGSRAAGLAMAFKLLDAAQDRWRAINGPKLVVLVRAGATFRKGVLVESSLREEEVAA